MSLPVFGNAKDLTPDADYPYKEVCMTYNTLTSKNWDMHEDDYRMYRRSGYYGSFYYDRDIDIDESLKPLIQMLKVYDHHRKILEDKGGHISNLDDLTKLLTTPMKIETRYEKATASLVDQMKLRQVVRDIYRGLRINVRQLPNQMPVFYICRIRRDHWSEYSLIVEDLYMSPGYPIVDNRFIKLMSSGHENYFLRLSQFRKQIKKYNRNQKESSAEKIDDYLYELGRYLLQAAWHEDQRLGFLVADLLRLPEFFQAVELLYLCLSAELCELRGAVNDNLRLFFEKIYPQPAILAFLEILTGLEGDMLNTLPLHAIRLYRNLSIAFSKFLATEVAWSTQKSKIPLWKILYANFSRLDMVARNLIGDKGLSKAGRKLENQSEAIINSVIKGNYGGKPATLS